MVDEEAVPDGLLLVVAAALVDASARVLVQQRPPGKALAGLWEFPGGKVEPGERPEAALIRELREELGIEVAAADLSPGPFVSAGSGDRHLLMLLYVVRRWRGEPRAIEATGLHWDRPAELRTLTMPPADRPLVAWLTATLQQEEMEARAGIEPACKDLQSSA